MNIYTDLIVDMIKEGQRKNEPVLLSEIAERMKERYTVSISELIEFIDDAILSEDIEFCVVSKEEIE